MSQYQRPLINTSHAQQQYEDGNPSSPTVITLNSAHTNGALSNANTTGTTATTTALSYLARLFPQKKSDAGVFWSRVTLALLVLSACIQLALESALIADEQSLFAALKQIPQDQLRNIPEDSPTKTFYEKFSAQYVYHSCFIATVLFGVYATWDAVIHQNIIQIIGMSLFNFGTFVFTIIQQQQAFVSYDQLKSDDVQNTLAYWNVVVDDPTKHGAFKIYLIMNILVSLVWMIIFIGLSYMLFKEFGWRIYRITGGDKAMEKAFTYYHVLFLHHKFTVFFIVLFSIIILALADPNPASKVLVPVVGIPFAILTAVSGFYGARYEIKKYIYFFFFGTVCMAIYTVWRISRVYNAESAKDYKNIQLPIMFFALSALALNLSSIVFGGFVFNGFGCGLKDVLDQQRNEEIAERGFGFGFGGKGGNGGAGGGEDGKAMMYELGNVGRRENAAVGRSTPVMQRVVVNLDD
ncbi:hypothetical protein HDU76_004924 [Blyttiomyces sp. JEL0837]|nr:hypothetical protein HDU76_004924 [Blyttiomyces sp. JEL0837]